MEIIVSFCSVLSSLKLFGSDYPESTRVLLYRGDQRYLKDGILIVPVEEYLKGLVPRTRLPEGKWLFGSLY